LLGSHVVDANVLDLFAGTGSVGLEALSRGARQATFIDKDRLALNTINANLRLLGFADRGHVQRADAFILLRNDPRAGFDYIHVAPPQEKGLWSQALSAIDARPHWLNIDGVVVVQIAPRELQALPLQNLVLYDQRRYGSTLLCFYERPGT
jgi:16S rRNA (guanine(966)-N(2))-methyltransferase RsmD